MFIHLLELPASLSRSTGLRNHALFFGPLICSFFQAVQNVMVSDRHCFECYGYDIIVDNNLKPWLVEVNASPSLSATTESDRVMKMSLLRDIFAVVVPPDFSDPSYRGPASMGPCQDAGGFYVLYDEEAEAQAEKERAEAAAPTRGSRGSGGGNKNSYRTSSTNQHSMGRSWR
ncbi:unnamed protein product [Choristocarpus tenellus]